MNVAVHSTFTDLPNYFAVSGMPRPMAASLLRKYFREVGVPESSIEELVQARLGSEYNPVLLRKKLLE